VQLSTEQASCNNAGIDESQNQNHLHLLDPPTQIYQIKRTFPESCNASGGSSGQYWRRSLC